MHAFHIDAGVLRPHQRLEREHERPAREIRACRSAHRPNRRGRGRKSAVESLLGIGKTAPLSVAPPRNRCRGRLIRHFSASRFVFAYFGTSPNGSSLSPGCGQAGTAAHPLPDHDSFGSSQIPLGGEAGSGVNLKGVPDRASSPWEINREWPPMDANSSGIPFERGRSWEILSPRQSRGAESPDLRPFAFIRGSHNPVETRFRLT